MNETTRRIRFLLAILPLVGVAASGCGSQGITPQTRSVASDSADQVIEGMHTKITTGGVRRSEVSADTAYLYSNRSVADLRRVTALFFDLNGNQTSTLTARTGIYQMQSGALEARGDVRVVAADGTNRRLETQHLVYDPNLNQIRSDSAFTYEGPDGVGRGESFRSDPEFRNVVTSQPTGRQRGQGLLLPGQRP